MSKPRTLDRIVPAIPTLEGDGVAIHRAFPTGNLADIDPFLLLDQMGPVDMAAGQARGFPDHPHRGFETVTYMLEGEIEHRDSRGNHGVISPGGVQWMTAGAGLVHSELPGAEIIRNGGRLHGFQLWVNLPRRDKMTPPRYQELPAAGIPIAQSGGVKVRIVAGEALGHKGAVETHTPMLYLHATLEPGAEFVQAVPASLNAFAYVIDGEANFSGKLARASSLAIFRPNGDAVEMGNGATRPLDVLLVAGEPLREPVARMGPFVMNTREELYQAFEDYRAGRLGEIAR